MPPHGRRTVDRRRAWWPIDRIPPRRGTEETVPSKVTNDCEERYVPENPDVVKPKEPGSRGAITVAIIGAVGTRLRSGRGHGVATG
jgi:hypothetical protein